MKISMIAAMDENNGIGKNGKLLWHLSKDLKWMKEKTMGHVIVMGRNSYLDIISYTKGKPLPGRTNVVLSSQSPESFQPDFIVCKTFDEVVKKYSDEEKIYILGGAQVYKALLPLADELIITHVHANYEADAFFPKWDNNKFIKTFEQKEEEKEINFTFTIYNKKYE